MLEIETEPSMIRQQVLGQFFDLLPDGVCISIQNEILYANKAFADIVAAPKKNTRVSLIIKWKTFTLSFPTYINEKLPQFTDRIGKSESCIMSFNNFLDTRYSDGMKIRQVQEMKG